MTDEELKALVASLAVAQDRTDKQMKATDEKIANLFAAQDRTDEQIKATDEQIKATNQQIKATNEQIKRNDKRLTEKLERMGVTLGNIGQNQGDVAEEFFFNSLIKDNHLGAIHFDDVVKNMEKHRGQIQEEYDLVVTNGEAIGIVEVKYKAHENDLDKLDRKMKNFKKLFPIYQNYKQYGAIASFHINDAAKKEALRRGYFVLQRSGDLVHTESGEHLTVL